MMELANGIKHVKDAYRVKQTEQKVKFCLGDRFIDIFNRDEKEKFILEISWCVHKLGLSRVQQHVPEIVLEALVAHSLNCIDALFTGETPLTVDLNLPCDSYGFAPLHFVVLSSPRRCSPAMIELLLCNGANPDIRFKPVEDTYKMYAAMLPLQMALCQTS